MTTLERIETPLAAFTARWTSKGLYSFVFERENRSDALADDGPPAEKSELLRRAIHTYFQSGNLELDLEILDWSGLTEFQQAVLRSCCCIPMGETWTYGQLATNAGNPKAARAAGGVMAGNRWPLIIPCHRVVGASGKLTGYSGVGGLQTKRELLNFEAEKSESLGKDSFFARQYS